MDLAQIFHGRQRQQKPPQGNDDKSSPGRTLRQTVTHSAGQQKADNQEEGNDAADITIAIAPGGDKIHALGHGNVRQEGVIKNIGSGPADPGKDKEKQAKQPLTPTNEDQREGKNKAEEKEKEEKPLLTSPVIGHRPEDRRQNGKNQGRRRIGKAPIGGGFHPAHRGRGDILEKDRHEGGYHYQHKGRVADIIQHPAQFFLGHFRQFTHG